MAAIALIACSTAALGTLLTASWTDAALPEPVDIVQLPSPMQTGALFSGAPQQSPADEPKQNDPVEALLATAPQPTAPPAEVAETSEPATPTPEPQPARVTDSFVGPPAPSAETPPRESPRQARVSPAPDGPFAGVWGTDERACSPQLNRNGLIPALINSQGAWAGETTCSFNTGKRVGNTWTFAAECSDTRRRWKTNVRMSVAGNRLTWTSKRGSQTYVRCQQGLLHADERTKASSPV